MSNANKITGSPKRKKILLILNVVRMSHKCKKKLKNLIEEKELVAFGPFEILQKQFYLCLRTTNGKAVL